MMRTKQTSTATASFASRYKDGPKIKVQTKHVQNDEIRLDNAIRTKAESVSEWVGVCQTTPDASFGLR
jgi:hypothetical protein